MRTARTLLLPLLVVLMLAGSWHHWGDRALPLLLAPLGLHDVRLNQFNLAAGSLHIGRFTATLDRPAGAIRFDLNNILCRYRLVDLIRGTVAALSMDRAEITILTVPVADTKPVLPDIAGVLKRIVNASQHLNQLQISRLLVHPNASDGRQHPTLAVSMTTKTTGKTLTLAMADAHPDTPAPMTAQIELNRDHFNGTLKADMEVLKAFTTETGKASFPTRGRIAAQWVLDWRQMDAQSVHLLLSLSNIQWQRVRAETIDLQVDGTWTPANQTLQLGPSSQLVMNNGQRDHLAVAAVEAHLAGLVGLKPDGWQVQINPATSWTAQGLVLNSVHLNPLHLNVLQATVRRTGDTIKAHSRFNPPQGAGTLQADLEYFPGNKGSGTATLKTIEPLIMSASSNLLLLLPSAKTTPFILKSGEVGMDLQLRWSKRNSPDLHGWFSLEKGEGMMGESPVSGLALRQNLRLLPILESIEPGVVEIEHTGGPVALEHLRLATVVQRSDAGPLPCLVLAEASVKLFGGKITADQCVYDPNLPTNSCQLHIAHVELPKILALQNVNGLEASGTVEGQLPLKLSREGVTISEGELHSINDGGIIRYQPPAGPFPQSQLTAYALKALEEFRYQQLSAGIGYQPEGILTAQLRLVGQSPHLDTNRPMHLNINTEQNLLSLLKSIRYSQGLSSELEQGMQRHTPPTHSD